jgi:hypothetical protein
LGTLSACPQGRRTTRTSADDWFDPKLHQDTDLLVDPFLMFQSTDPRWSTVHDRIIEFFNHALMHVAAGHRNLQDAGIFYNAVFVDARPKPSASKLKRSTS